MGLDVYLYRIDNLKEKLKLEEYIDEDAIQFNSELHPTHPFKIGYFRSSYNEGGLNSLLKSFDLPDLYEVFDVTNNPDYYLQPDWGKALKNITSLIHKFKTCMNSNQAKFGCTQMRFIYSSAPKSAHEALELFFNEHNQAHKEGFSSYSNKDGYFFHDEPLKVRAVLQGSYYNTPTTFVVYERDQSALVWYLEALEIVKETIEFVMSKKDRNKYYLGWSA
jgi:hypothetical protein